MDLGPYLEQNKQADIQYSHIFYFEYTQMAFTSFSLARDLKCCFWKSARVL